MFGHGVFDSPLKTFNASPYCSQDSNKTAAEKVIGCPPWRGDYYNNYVEGVEPDWNSTWDEDAEIDRQFNLDTQQWQAKEKQLRDFMGLLFQIVGYGSNHELRWCHNEKYGTKLHWWLYDKDDTSTHAAKSSMEASALSHSEVKGMIFMIAGTLDNWRQHLSGPIWEKAFDYLASLTPYSSEEKTLLQGEGLFGRVMILHSV